MGVTTRDLETLCAILRNHFSMLYYNYRSHGETKATYSGRFSFILLKDEDEYLALKSLQNGNDLQNLWRPRKSEKLEKVAPILAHEYTHKHIFSGSATGHILNGWRLWARIRFLRNGCPKELIKYYRARTIYVMETYAYQEAIAARMDESISKETQSVQDTLERIIKTEFNKEIESTESYIRRKWTELNIAPNRIHESLYHPLGKWLQANFALMISYPDVEGKIVDAGFADKGIANDVGTIRGDERYRSILLKKIFLNWFTLPIRRRESFQKYFDWFWEGQRAQFEMLQQVYGMQFEDFHMQYLLPAAQFIANWAGVPQILKTQLMTLTEDAFLLDRNRFMDKWEDFLEAHQSNSRFERYFTFFHLHGN